MVNKEYKSIQIPADSYAILREYCDKRGLKMGRFIATLVDERCVQKPPTPPRNVLKVTEGK
jgi:hypothetical protein